MRIRSSALIDDIMRKRCDRIRFTIPESHSCILSQTTILNASTAGFNGPRSSENALCTGIQHVHHNSQETHQSRGP
jgi:hypothetical protein